MDAFEHIYAQYSAFTPKQKSIADYWLANPQDVCYISLKEMSLRTGSSEVSVLRTCRALGFESYLQLKDQFRSHAQHLQQMLEPPTFMDDCVSASLSRDKLQLLQDICAEDHTNLSDFLRGLNAPLIFEVARSLMTAGDVFIFGHDVSKIFADYLYNRLTFLRIKATPVKLGDNETLQSILARLRPEDHVVLFSFPPYHLPIYNVARFAEQRGVAITTITDSLHSPAVTEHSRNLMCRTSTRFFYNSHTLIMALINLLVSCIAIEMGEQYNQILADERRINQFMNSTPGPDVVPQD